MIVDKRNNTIDEINVGEYFYYKGHLCMKIKIYDFSVTPGLVVLSGGAEFPNMILDIENGKVFALRDSVVVQSVNVEIVVS